jgi:hypothetical protein
MKLSAKLARLRKRKEHRTAASSEDAFSLSVSTWVLISLSLALAGLGTWAVFEFFVWTRVPPALVGLWDFDEGPEKRATFEFFRDGTLEIQARGPKKALNHKAQVTVRGKTLFMDARNPLAAGNSTNEAVIRELTADTLILELERGDVLKMVRIE